LPAGGRLHALVKDHCDVGAEGDLHVHRVLGREEMFAAVEVRAKLHAVGGHFAQLAQAEDLEAAGVGEHRPVPAHKAVHAAHAPPFESRMNMPLFQLYGCDNVRPPQRMKRRFASLRSIAAQSGRQFYGTSSRSTAFATLMSSDMRLNSLCTTCSFLPISLKSIALPSIAVCTSASFHSPPCSISCSVLKLLPA